jgi:hypothetical protein
MRAYNKEFLNEKAEKMLTYLSQPTPTAQDEERIVTHLMHLGRMLTESGEYMAYSKYRVDEITHGEIGKAIDTALADKMGASTINAYVKSACKEWNYLVNVFDRINSASGKLIQAVQTLISYEKAKMNLL